MRIGLVFGILSSGGCERRMAELGRVLMDRGDEVYILANAHYGQGPPFLEERRRLRQYVERNHDLQQQVTKLRKFYALHQEWHSGAHG